MNSFLPSNVVLIVTAVRVSLFRFRAEKWFINVVRFTLERDVFHFYFPDALHMHVSTHFPLKVILTLLSWLNFLLFKRHNMWQLFQSFQGE